MILRPRNARHAARNVSAPPPAVAQPLEPRTLLSGTQFNLGSPRDTVFDAARNLLYVTTGQGTVERIDLATMSLLAPWNVGTSLNGADITPDGSALFVTEDGRYADDPTTEGPDAIVHKVNLASGTVTDITYALGFQEVGGLDAQVAANGKVYVTSGRTGSSVLSELVEIDVATGAASRRQGVRTYTGALLSRSADRRTLILGAGTAWDVQGGTITDLGGGALEYGFPVSRDGRLFVVGSGGAAGSVTTLVDSTAKPLHHFGYGDAVAFDPVRDRLYVASPGEMNVYDTNTFERLQRINGSGTEVSWPNFWPITVSDDGGRVATVRPGVVTVHTLAASDGVAAQIEVGGLPASFSAERPAQFTVTVRDAGGAVATGYRGTVSFRSSDPRATLPAPYTFAAEDAGTKTFAATLRTPTEGLGATIEAVDLSGGFAGTSAPVPVQALSAQAMVTVPYRRSHVFDPQRGLLYITTDYGKVERFDPAARSLLAPIVIGAPVGGIDITPDGSALYVGTRVGTGKYSTLTRVDLDAGVTARGGVPHLIPVPTRSEETGTYDVAVGPTGRVLFSAEGISDYKVPLRSLDPASGAVRVRSDYQPDGLVPTKTNLTRGPGRNLVYVGHTAEFGQTPRATYNANTDTFSARTNLATPIRAGVSADGTRVAANDQLLSASLAFVRNLSDNVSGGAAFDPVRSRLYGMTPAGVVAINPATGARLFTIPLGAPLGSDDRGDGRSFGLTAGVASVSPDGLWYFVSTGGYDQWPSVTPAAVRAYPLVTSPVLSGTGAPGTGPLFAAADGTLTVRVTAVDPAGATDAAYAGTVRLTSTDPMMAPVEYTFTAGDAGVKELTVRFAAPGRHALTVTDAATGMASSVYDVYVAGPGLGPDGTLFLTGTDLGDAFTVTSDGSNVTVVGTGAAGASFPLSSVVRIEAITFDGDDTVTVGPRVPGGLLDLGGGEDTADVTPGDAAQLPLSILGGDGSDRAIVRAGGGAQSVRFEGGAFNDTFVGEGTAAADSMAVTSISATVGNTTVALTGTEVFELYGRGGDDALDARGIPLNMGVAVFGGDGNDQLSAGPGLGGVNNVGVPVRALFYGEAGDDTLTRRAGGGSAKTYTEYYGGDGFDTFVFFGTGRIGTNARDGFGDDNGSTYFGGTERLVWEGVGGSNLFDVRFSADGFLPELIINGNDGNDTLDVSWPTLLPASFRPVFNGGEGADSVTVGTLALRAIDVNGGPGSDSVTMVGRPTANAYVVRPDRVGDATRSVYDRDVELATLRGANAADTFDVVPRATTAVSIDGAAPTSGSSTDRLTVDLTGTQDPVLTTGPAAGQGRLAFSNRAPIGFLGIEQVPDLALVVTSAAYTAGAAPALRVVFSENVGTTLALSDLAVVATPSGTVVPAARMSLAYDAATNTATVTFPGYPAGALPAGTYRVDLAANSVADPGGRSNDNASSKTFVASSAVLGRHTFYNRSALDGNNPAPNAADDAAIAADKQALLPGEAAGLANVTSYTRGVNGAMIDVAGLAVIPASSEFVVEAAGADGVWRPVAGTVTVGYRQGAGVGGTDRLTLVLPDGTARNGWLRVTMKAGGGTGLAAADVFFFGNLVGDSGGPGRPTVDALDLLRTRARVGRTDAASLASFDFDRDGDVDAADVMTVRANQRRSLGPPPETPAPAAVGLPPVRPAARAARRSVLSDVLGPSA